MTIELKDLESLKRNPYEEFLITEYTNIAGAHFNTVNTIATFFKHYLLIISLPLPFLSILLNQAKNSSNYSFLSAVQFSVPLISLILSIVGVCVLIYISNLWFDQQLYARTVNGIRSYFYRNSGISALDSSSIRVLPISTNVPNYKGNKYFDGIGICLTIINSLYFSFSAYFFCKYNELFKDWPFYEWTRNLFLSIITHWPWFTTEIVTCVSFFAFVVFNYLVFINLSNNRDKSYLQSQTIGIDIDGVIGDHRNQFCQFLKKHTDKIVDPDKITYIPVHKCKGLNVSKNDEMLVFNDPDYWKGMPTRKDAKQGVKQIRKYFPNHTIHLFTARPWPLDNNGNDVDFDQVRKDWGKAAPTFPFFKREMDKITKNWLKDNGIDFDNLTVENSKSQFKSRFSVSSQGLVQIFIEDDLENAIRLSYLCDKVLLLDEPYNQCNDEELPQNVIRVLAWEDIIQELPKNLGGHFSEV